jgi:hypothetical protein
MILVNDRQGYRVCLECHQGFEQGDESAWLSEHLGCESTSPQASAA